MTIHDLAAITVKANDERLAGTMTREAHAIFIQQIDVNLVRNGWTWDDLAAVAR